MNEIKNLIPQFVEYVPEQLDENILYVSMKYRTAIHLCVCGCCQKVVTPLGINDWTLKYDGRISLSPSIGNWSFNCHSHYWIKKNKIKWAPKWSEERILEERLAQNENENPEKEPTLKLRW